jgi:hypothetical protein
MLLAVLTVTAIQEALNRPSLKGGFYGDKRSLAIIERAVEIGVVRRISTTQAEWEDENSADEFGRYISSWIEENGGDMPMVAYEGRKYLITYRREIEVEADNLDKAKELFEGRSKHHLNSNSSFVAIHGIEDIT